MSVTARQISANTDPIEILDVIQYIGSLNTKALPEALIQVPSTSVTKDYVLRHAPPETRWAAEYESSQKLKLRSALCVDQRSRKVEDSETSLWKIHSRGILSRFRDISKFHRHLLSHQRLSGQALQAALRKVRLSKRTRSISHTKRFRLRLRGASNPRSTPAAQTFPA